MALFLRGLIAFLVCVTALGADRTRVERIPVGTTGAITSINVKAYFYTYDGSSVTAKYLMEWVETTAGVLSGARTVKAAAPGGSYGSPTTITSTYLAAWVPQFTASWNVEAETGWKYADVLPLAGAAWFSAPNDTLTYIQDTWRSEAEGGGGDDPGYSPSGASSYIPFSPITGTFTYNSYADLNPNWIAGATFGTAPSHCRSVKAFARTSNIGLNRYVRLVWDEVVSSENAIRYAPLFYWDPSITQTSSSSPMFHFAHGIISYTASTFASAGSSLATTTPGVSSYRLGNIIGGSSAADTHVGSTTAIIERFVAAYNRDHGSGGNAAALAAFASTSGLAYWPDVPDGAAVFNYESFALNAVPLFDTCSGGTGSGEGGSGGGTYTGPAADAFPSSTLPGDAGTKVITGNPVPSGLAASFGAFVMDYTSVNSLDATAAVLVIPVTLPGQEDPTDFTFSSLPDTETTLGVALEAFRVLIRTVLVIIVIWRFGKRAYADLVVY